MICFCNTAVDIYDIISLDIFIPKHAHIFVCVFQCIAEFIVTGSLLDWALPLGISSAPLCYRVQEVFVCESFIDFWSQSGI